MYKKSCFFFLFFFLVVFCFSLQAKEKKIVTSFYPLTFLANSIVGQEKKAISVQTLSNKDPHHFTPSAKQIYNAVQADLFLYIDDSLEAWADSIAEQRKGKSQKISSWVALEEVEEHREDEHDHKDEHDHSNLDPHLWLSPYALAKSSTFLGKEIANIDPKNASSYLQNTATLRQKFLQLDKKYKSELSKCSKDSIIITHNFIGYLTRRYNFESYPIIGLSTLDEPSAKNILELKKVAKSKDIAYVLIEDFTKNKYAQILVKEANLKSLPIDNLTVESSKDYFARMESNLQNLKIALFCN